MEGAVGYGAVKKCVVGVIRSVREPFGDDTMTSQKGHALLLGLLSAMFCGAVYGSSGKRVLLTD